MNPGAHLRAHVLPWLAAALVACADDTLTGTGTDEGAPNVTGAPDASVAGEAPDAGDAAQTPQAEVLTPAPVGWVDVHDVRTGPPYPVVLVHGLNGFRDIGPLDYFFRVPAALEQAGHRVFVTAVAPYNASELRAQWLAPQIDEILRVSGARRVNLIAHSQGGLDSRYLISTLGYGDRVASLTTVSTPHRGTGVADVVLRGADFPGLTTVADGYAALFGLVAADAQNDPDARAAMETLSTERARAFNARNVDDPRVQYFSFAGRSNLQSADAVCGTAERPNPGAVDTLELALLGTWTVLADDLLDPTANDGLVTVESARWGRFMGCLPADHLDEIGQVADLLPDLVSGWDHVTFYVEWANALRTMGL